MEKLIKLLNERIIEKRNELSSTIGEPVDVGIYEYDKLEECITYDGYGVSDECIISKKEGFIEWLVDNDKIDFSREGEYCTKSIEEFDGLLRDDEDGLIMILAISDTPVDDLISYLK